MPITGEVRFVANFEEGKQELKERAALVVTVKRAPPREHFVDNRAEREQVRTGVGGLAPGLLGGHVPDGPQQYSLLRGRPRPDLLPLLFSLGRLAPLGQAEVEDLEPAILGEEQVLRLEVTVDEPARVGGGETAAHLHRQLHCLAGRKRAVLQPLAQRLALEQFEDDLSGPVLGTVVVDGEDVGMIQGGNRPGLLLEAVEAVEAWIAVGGDDLDRDVAAEAGVSGTVNLAHPSRPERGQKFVWTETAAR